MGIPGIVGWPEDDFVVALHAYKQGLRPHPVMQMMAQRPDDEQIAALAGLTDGNWAPVTPTDMRSRVDTNCFVLGDSSAQGAMPKSGFSANSQAKVAANAVRADLTGSRLFPARYSNTCWSLIAPEDGVKVGASYEPGAEQIESVSSFVSQVGESADVRRQTYEESLGWYAGITADIFG